MIRAALVIVLAVPAAALAGDPAEAEPLRPAAATEIVAKPQGPEIQVIVARQAVAAETPPAAPADADRLEPIVRSLDRAPF